MKTECTFQKVLIHDGVAYISSQCFNVVEKFVTQPISILDISFTLTSDYTRWMPVRRFAHYIRELLGVTSNEALQSYFDLPFAPQTDVSVVRYFLDSLDMKEHVHHLVFDDFWFNDCFYVFKK